MVERVLSPGECACLRAERVCADSSLAALLSQKGAAWANFFGGYTQQHDDGRALSASLNVPGT